MNFGSLGFRQEEGGCLSPLAGAQLQKRCMALMAGEKEQVLLVDVFVLDRPDSCIKSSVP